MPKNKGVPQTEGVANLSRSAIARYIQLATLFRRRIETGYWSVGEQIPTVEELATEYGVARATIRQAIGLLEDEGMVERFRAKGTFVTKRPQDQLWCEVETNFAGLLVARQGADIQVLSEEKVERPPLVPHAIGELAPVYRHLRRLHSRNGEPFLFADVYLDEELAKKLPRTAFSTRTALRLASSAPGIEIVDARQTLMIGSADLETAEHLRISLNAPVAYVNRSAVDNNGRLVLIAIGSYRGDIVRLDMKLSP
jgi:GntR family transcriptional regulator